MNFKPPFATEVRIRLTDSLNGFVCSVQRGWLYQTSDEFAIEPSPVQSLEPIDRFCEPVRAQYRPKLRSL